ncbi:MAG: heavy metal-responsive transcriptional regulator [Desulfuromonadales bacterium]|jgi:MerR family copper efflux transcriptional regulator
MMKTTMTTGVQPNMLTIGKVAKKAGIGIETVRFYEKEGLIGPAARTASNYRVYRDKDIARLRFIRKAKSLGFTLKEIKELLALRHDPDARKEEVKMQTEAKIADIEEKIRHLIRIKTILETLDKRCDGHGPASECPILDALESDGDFDSD